LIEGQVAQDKYWTIPGPVPSSEAFTLQLVRQRPAAPAAALVAHIDSPSLLATIAASEHRRAVLLALATNPYLPDPALDRILSYAASQPPKVQEQFARILLERLFLARPSQRLQLLLGNPWLRQTHQGILALTDCAQSLGSADLTTIQEYTQAVSDPRAAGSAITSILNGPVYGPRGKVLPVSVLAELYTKAHPRNCTHTCQAVSRWARRARPTDLFTLLDAVACPLVSAHLLAYYQQKPTLPKRPRPDQLLRYLFVTVSVMDSYSYLLGWLGRLASAGGVVDELLVGYLVKYLTPRISPLPWGSPLPPFTPAAALVLAASDDWQIAHAALGAIPDPTTRCAKATAWITTHPTTQWNSSTNRLSSLADSPAMLEIVTDLSPAEFKIWATAIWDDAGSFAFPKSFVDRSVAVLDLETLDLADPALDRDQLDCLVHRLTTADPNSPQVRTMVEWVVTVRGSSLSKAQLFGLTPAMPVSDLLMLLPTSLGQPTALEAADLPELISHHPHLASEVWPHLHHSDSAGCPWLATALAIVPLQWDYLPAPAWAIIDQCFAQAFGSHTQPWTIAIGLLENWTGTLPELIDTALALVPPPAAKPLWTLC
jgi:hypothetical protein